jgi:hypothetical protein
MATTPSELKKIFPEFANEPNSRLNFFINAAVTRLNPDAFCDKYDQAVCFLSAHLLTLSNRAGQGGSVTSEKVGDLARSYSAPKGASDGSSYSSTSYGQMFEDLLRSCRSVPRVLNCQKHS